VILQILGLEIGPILAGVGIFGLAVGFAAQSLIKDFINGLFILFEGSLSVGDIVQLRGIGGQVEKFTLRAVTIRDLSGNVHVIPNSGIDMVTNMTKGYSRYLLDVGVAYGEDVDTVIAILCEIDEEMRRDPTYARDMLEPIEIMGLDRFDESAVIIRARLKTRPIEQWRIGREFNRRMKKVFDQRGIEIPFPHRTLYWGQSKQTEQTPLEVIVSPITEHDAQAARQGASRNRK
jgi:small conductance mechanosensitive channel